MSKDDSLCVKCGGFRYTGVSICSECKKELAGSLRFPEDCPWPEGDNLETGFPCGPMAVDLGENEKLQEYIPGIFLFERSDDVISEFTSGEEIQEELEKGVESEGEDFDFRHLIESCVDCAHADWQNFALSINSRISAE